MTRIFFIHVAKIGGISVGTFLWSLFDPAEICPPPPDSIWDAEHAAEARRFKLISGHFDMDYVHQVNQPGLTLCMLRNPYQRIRSLYDFWRSHTWQFVEARVQANGVRFSKQSTFDDFLQAGNAFIQQRVWNATTRQLLGHKRYPEFNGDQEKAAAAAFAVLKSLNWFGLSEFSQESLRRLAGILHVDPPRELPRLNQTYDGAPEYDQAGMLKRQRVLKTVLLQKHRKLIATTNRADIMLYNMAVDLFFSTGHRNGSSVDERRSKTQPVKDEQVLRVVNDLNRRGGIYHKMVLGDGLVVNGEYDMSKFIHHFAIPSDLSGHSALDIGTACGFFAFECARRGAGVTAIDIWDGSFFDDFQRALGLSVNYVQRSVYDLDESFGQFDLVICGSLLLHLPDVFGALRKILAVCKGLAIFSTAFLEDPERSERGYCEFIGQKHKPWYVGFDAQNGEAGDVKLQEYGTYWHISPNALRRMLLAAGFADVHEVSRFMLVSEPEGHGFSIPHMVMHATA